MRRLPLALLLLPALAGATDVTIKGSTYTLAAHPRVLMDGPSGTITARVKDPDGAGAGVAPQATDANPSFVALKAYIDGCSAAPTYCSSLSERGTAVMAGALRWYMDNSQTDAKAMAIYWLNNVETWIASSYGFSCDVTGQYCGISSWSDWPSSTMGELALAYTILRSEMSAGERTAFAQKMFNDDVATYEDGCDNQLQQEVGATATYTSGSTAVTGTNLSGLTAGRKVYFRQASGWATIATVNSAESITLTGAPQTPLGGNAGSQTGGQIFEMKPWTSTTCGLAWMLQHHAYSPRTAKMNYLSLSHTNNYAIDGTTLTLASVTGLPSPPFHIHIPGRNETMLVTAVNGNNLTVTRAQMLTSASAAQYPPRPVQYSVYIPRVGSGEPGSNLVIQKLAGFLLMGLALADDSATAVDYVEAMADYWIDNTYAQNRVMWTGVQQGGSTSYGNGRILSMNHQVAVALKNIDAALDKSGGNWLTSIADFYIMTSEPSSVGTNLPYGQPDLNQVASYASHIWAPIQLNLLGSTGDHATHWNYFQRSVTSWYTSANLTSGANERMIPYLLLYQEEGFTSTDYRATKPTAKAFNVADGDGTRTLNAWVSRTGYSSTSDTLIYAQGYNLNYTQDHIGTGGPGGYRIFKNGFQLTENGAYDMGQGAATNMPLFGGAANLKTTAQFQRVDLDRSDLGTSWAFARFNLVNAYTAAATATRALRHLVHIKPSGGQDYLIAYDSLASSVAKTLGFNLFYDKPSSTMTDDTLPSLVWTGSNRRLSTQVVLPAGTGVARTYSSQTNAHAITLCTSSDGSACASASSAEYLVVHRPSTSVSDAMPTVAALGTIDADFSGVQIEDASNPAVAVFAKAGADQTSGSFTSTHSGTAQYVVTGLSAGSYDVVRGGATTVLDDEVVGTDGTLAFESTAGAFTITEGTAPPPSITITTTSLPNHVEDVAGYSQTLAYTGGTGSVTWSVTAGSLCAGLTLTGATGEIAGTPTTQQTCSFTVTATDSASPTPQTDTQDLSITITAAPPACVITTTALPNGTRQVAYSQVLASSGCTAPLSWTITSGTICTGLTLTEATGAISGTPTVVQSCPMTVRLADSAAGVDTEALSITIDAPAPAVLNITTTSPLPSCVQHQPCSTTFQATGGTLPYTWTKASGTYCVGNDSLSGATLSGVPTTIETCSFTMQVEDDDSATDTQTFQRSIVNPSPSLTVQTIVGSQAVIVKFSTPAMDGSELCNVTVTDEELDDTTGLPIGPVGSAVSSQGRSTRVVTVGGLTAEHRHSVSVICGSVASGSALFTTPAAVGGTISWKYVAVPSARLQAQSAAKLKVYYALPGEAEASSTNASCGSGCTVTLSLTSGAIYNIRHQWLTSGDAVLATTQTSPVVVP